MQLRKEHPLPSLTKWLDIETRLKNAFGKNLKMVLYAANYESPHQALEQWVLVHKKQQYITYIAYHENQEPMVTVHIPQLEAVTTSDVVG